MLSHGKKAEGSTEDLEGQQLAVTMASQHDLEDENQKTIAIIKEKVYLFLVKKKKAFVYISCVEVI